jgi:hypothetical protein
MATEDDIYQWIRNYPRAWDQLCQALMWQMCNKFGAVAPWTNASAIDAYQVEYEAGRISHYSAPVGAFVYFDIGKDGHVGFMMNDGRVFMATSHLAEEWTVSDAGWNTLEAYIEATGATYLGWSYLNGGNTMNFTPDDGTTAGGDYTRIDETDDDMKIIYVATANGTGDAAWIKKGDAFANDFVSPITLLARSELDSLDWFAMPEHGGMAYRKALWSPADIRNLIKTRGLRPTSGPFNESNYGEVLY